MSEERDLEKELKEETDRYHRQNQEAFDMESEYELKRRKLREQRQAQRRKKKKETDTEGNTLTNSPGQTFKRGEQITGTTPPDTDMRTGEMIPDDTEEDEYGNPRFLESTAFETGMNLALDAKTNWLLAAPFPGARPIYAIANIGGSGIINYISQRIRGTKFSLGELATASGLSLVPGVTNVKSAKGVAKAVSRGAVIGGTQVTSESLIDTGEFPDAETFTAGTVMGGSLGGIFQHTANSSDDIGKFLGRIRTRLKGSKQLITPEGIPIDAADVPTTAFASTTNTTSSNPNFGGDGGFFKKVVQKAFRNKATFPSLFVDPVTLKPKRGFTNFEMASAYDRYIDNLAKKSGYKSLADFKVQVLDTLGPNDKMNLFRKLQDGENLRTGYIEHMVAKASKKARLERIRKANPVLAEDEGYLASELSRKSRDTYDMDWYWDETYIDKNGVTRPGLNKGDRDASRNVRINFNNRYKALKDVTEQVLYGTEADPGVGLLTSDLKNRLIVSIEDIDKRSFTFNRTQLGDVVIRRAGDNKLVGKLGNYLDVLYPQNNNAKSLLERNVLQQINPNTGAKFTSLDDFRDYMIRDRVGIILDELPNLSGKSNRQRQRIIDEALAEDLAKLYEDFPFLPKPKYISEITDKGLDQNVIKPPVTESNVVQQELPDIKE
jgi:hypothetical protein